MLPRRHIYDFVRQPRVPNFADNEYVTIIPRAFNAELTCPICLDVLKNTMRSKECLHRFCKDCITRALRIGNKECPTCRAALPSKRSLVADPNYDAVIEVIASTQESDEQPDAAQNGLTATGPYCSATMSRTCLPSGQQAQDQMILFYLRAHPAMSLPDNLAPILLKEHFVRTCASSCTVAHIRKYLLMRSCVELLTKGDRQTSENVDQIIRQRIDQISIFARAGDYLISLVMCDCMNILTIFSKFRCQGLTYPLQFYYFYHEIGTTGFAIRTQPLSPIKISGVDFG
ncbi:zf-C3HC4 domain containing protein [Trichuris trichiura]|uniref:RING-type E3 ubiquitin transferase n=1 Tax=Trichuris trichiura TaxID=36087 RepID=A0A077ZGC9_TRITR|nr:zf-C3HC4 domain containing protein [Trichuris trichiura]